MPESPEIGGETLSVELRRLQHVVEFAVTAAVRGDLAKAERSLQEFRTRSGKLGRALEDLLGTSEVGPRGGFGKRPKRVAP